MKHVKLYWPKYFMMILHCMPQPGNSTAYPTTVHAGEECNPITDLADSADNTFISTIWTIVSYHCLPWSPLCPPVKVEVILLALVKTPERHSKQPTHYSPWTRSHISSGKWKLSLLNYESTHFNVSSGCIVISLWFNLRWLNFCRGLSTSSSSNEILTIHLI